MKQNNLLIWLFLGVVTLLILLIWTNGLELCSLIGGLWCYPPLSTLAEIANTIIIFLIIFGILFMFIKLAKLKMKGGKK